MLDDIREKKTSMTTYILVGMAGVGMLFLGVPFFAADSGVSVAEVNGQDISYNQFQRTVGNLQQSNPNLSLPQVEQEAMRQLISQKLLAEHAAESGFRYPNTALYETLKSRFNDEQGYQAYLNQIGMDAAGYERLLRNDLTMQTYYGMLSHAQTSQPGIIDVFIDNLTQRRTFSIVRLPLSDVAATVTATDDDIQAYYDEHKEALMQPPEVSLNYILFSAADVADPADITEEALAAAREAAIKKASKRDGEYLIFDQKEAAEEARQALESGTPLATVTAGIDDGTTGGEYGKLDLHSHGEGISPKADDALFALKQSGDISPVLDTDYGYMLVIAGQIEQGNVPDDAQLRKQLANDAAQARYHELSNKAFDASQSGADMAQIATMLNRPVKQTMLFTEQSPPEQWIAQPDVISQLFGEQAIAAGDMAQPVALDDERSVFFSLEQREAATLPPLDSIKEKVAKLAQNSLAETILTKTADNIAQSWTQAQPDQALLNEHDATLNTYADLAPGQPVEGLSNEVLRALFTQSGRINVLTAENGDKLIARLDTVSAGENNEALRTFIDKQWQAQAQMMSYQGILQWLTAHADIRITREPSVE